MNLDTALKFIRSNNLDIPEELILDIENNQEEAFTKLKDYVNNYIVLHREDLDENVLRLYINLYQHLEDIT